MDQDREIETAALRARRMTKNEVQMVARYCAIASNDKLIEALAFALINKADAETIQAELTRRLELRRNHPDSAFR